VSDPLRGSAAALVGPARRRFAPAARL